LIPDNRPATGRANNNNQLSADICYNSVNFLFLNLAAAAFIGKEAELL